MAHGDKDEGGREHSALISLDMLASAVVPRESPPAEASGLIDLGALGLNGEAPRPTGWGTTLVARPRRRALRYAAAALALVGASAATTYVLVGRNPASDRTPLPAEVAVAGAPAHAVTNAAAGMPVNAATGLPANAAAGADTANAAAEMPTNAAAGAAANAVAGADTANGSVASPIALGDGFGTPAQGAAAGPAGGAPADPPGSTGGTPVATAEAPGGDTPVANAAARDGAATAPGKGTTRTVAKRSKPATARSATRAGRAAPSNRHLASAKKASREVDDLLAALDRKPARQTPSARSKTRQAARSKSPATSKKLERADILRVVKQRSAAVKRCKSRAPGASGVVSVRMAIARTGRVTSAKASGPLARSPAGKCVESVARGMRFPEFSGDPLSISLPFTL